MSTPNVMYRVTSVRTDEQEVTIIFNEYQILRSTEKGHYIRLYSNRLPSDKQTNERWVPASGCKNPFAFVDKKEALNNFIHRQRRYVLILNWKVDTTKSVIDAAKRMLDTDSLVKTKVDLWNEE
jgi:hypothetical protein